MVTASVDGKIRLFDLKKDKCIQTLANPHETEAVLSIIQCDTTTFLTSGNDKKLRFW